MIIDSHAHYAHASFSNTFRYLTWDREGYALAEGGLEQLLECLKDAGINCTIEPGISLASNEAVLALSRKYPGYIFPAAGVHPTRTFRERWRDRKKLIPLAALPEVIAVGETGLDYHYKREDQHRFCQHMWFLYQLNLAWKVKKPVILHVRDAHADALRILKIHPARRLGGVVHCFTGDREAAEAYLDLGYHIGIGGALLQKPERAEKLWEAVERMPLERILLETDAPYVLPDCKEEIKPKQLRRARNSSLVLPAVAERIAQLKGISPEIVLETAARNAIRLFSLPLEPEQN